MSTSHWLRTLAGFAVGLPVLAAPALAQNALGDGTRLDRSLQHGMGGYNPPGSNFAETVRFRNAIVTGNAPGGFSFRGDVGYRAPGEFAGVLGSNDTFAFRRDALYSGLAGQGIRGTEALQYQFALTTGSHPRSTFLGSLAVNRAGTGANAAGLMRPEPGQDLPGEAPALISRPDPLEDRDERGLALWALRSPSAFVSTRSIEPTILGVTRDQAGQNLAITASALGGLRTIPLSEPQPPLPDGLERPGAEFERPEPGRTGAAQAGLAQPGLAQREVPGRSEIGELDAAPGARLDLAAPSTSESRLAARPGDEPPRTTYEELRARFTAEDEPASPDTPGDALAEFEQEIRALRERLAHGEPGQAVPPGIEPPIEQFPEGAVRPEPPAPAPGAVNEELIQRLRERAGELSSLNEGGRTLYDEHMQRAQELLAQGRYFDAEERFAAALSRRPGDPMAAVGRIHAQLGAAMFLSASVNLRTLLIEHPELAGVKYAPALLPSPERTREITARLGELITAERGLPRDAGLLLAYMGYQIGDRALIARGLDAMAAREPGGQPLPPESDAAQLQRLADVLRAMWLAPPGAAAPAPAAPEAEPAK